MGMQPPMHSLLSRHPTTIKGHPFPQSTQLSEGHNGTMRKEGDTQLVRLTSLVNSGSQWGARQEAKVTISNKRGISFSQV